MSERVRVVERLFEALNDHDPGRANGEYAADYVSSNPGRSEPLTLDEGTAYIQGFLDAFPDLSFELNHKIAQDDFVVINWIASGTQTGPLRTPTGDMLPATGKKAVVPGSSTYQFTNGKISRAWVHWDMATLLAQLGLMPGM